MLRVYGEGRTPPVHYPEMERFVWIPCLGLGWWTCVPLLCTIRRERFVWIPCLGNRYLISFGTQIRMLKITFSSYFCGRNVISELNPSQRASAVSGCLIFSKTANLFGAKRPWPRRIVGQISWIILTSVGASSPSHPLREPEAPWLAWFRDEKCTCPPLRSPRGTSAVGMCIFLGSSDAERVNTAEHVYRGESRGGVGRGAPYWDQYKSILRAENLRNALPNT